MTDHAVKGRELVDELERDEVLLADDEAGVLEESSDGGREAPDPSAGGGPERRHRLRYAELVVVVLVVAAWVLVQVRDSATDAPVADAAQRDAVVIAAADGIERLHSLDPAEAEADFAAWRAVTTGELRDQFEEVIAALEETRTELVAVVPEGGVAVTELDTAAGTARVMAVVEISRQSTTGDGLDEAVSHRLIAELVHVEGTWLLSDMESAESAELASGAGR